MSRKIWRTIIIIVVILVTLVLGMLIGAWFGGNYAQDFQFNGVRGYEATAQLGLICGSLALGVMGAIYWVKKK
jgi:flagellar basal body-associated protein FliL